MSSPGFHNTIYLHGPHDPTVRWTEAAGIGNPAFASIQTSGASILVRTVAEADALIRAAVAAKDLLLAAQAPQDGEDIQPLHQWRSAPLPEGAKA